MNTSNLSKQAKFQAQRRGIARRTLDLVLAHSDRSFKLPGQARALWISRQGRKRLAQLGFAQKEVERTSGVRLIVDHRDDVVVRVEHTLARRAWA